MSSLEQVAQKIVAITLASQPYRSTSRYSISCQLSRGTVDLSVFDTHNKHNKVVGMSVYICPFDIEHSLEELKQILPVVEKYNELNKKTRI